MENMFYVFNLGPKYQDNSYWFTLLFLLSSPKKRERKKKKSEGAITVSNQSNCMSAKSFYSCAKSWKETRKAQKFSPSFGVSLHYNRFKTNLVKPFHYSVAAMLSYKHKILGGLMFFGESFVQVGFTLVFGDNSSPIMLL